MSRGELSDQGYYHCSTECETLQLSPNFVTTCPLFNSNFLRGPHSSVPPSSRPSRFSSGRYSFDGDSGQMTMPMGHNQSTQTPSLACQAIHHAQHTLAQVQRLLNSGPQHVQIQGSSESLPMDVPIELWIGQELRRIGDEFVSIRIQAMNHRLPYNHMRNLWHWINAWLRRRRIDG